jgi:hypothetical protein
MSRHVVVDGSNLATEGRSMPSLTQLNEAVLAYMADHPHDTITVVVDATFGHRIDPSEVNEFNDAVANNELVAPPAGAVGRGDAFVLSIANKVGAIVLSNDSFQEFHPNYPWLFDEDRLIGGKPVPHVGWVFVARTPVRGPVSRRATRESKAKAGAEPVARRASKAASLPLPVPSAPPPGARLAKKAAPKAAATRAVAAAAAETPGRSGASVNDLLPFLEFVEHHPMGTEIDGVVSSYSSHGAYVDLVGGIKGYVPLRLMAKPMPRSARSVMKMGETVALEVASYNPSRRSVDLAVAGSGLAAGEMTSETTQAVSKEKRSATEPKGTNHMATKKVAKAAPKKAAAKAAAAPKKAVAKKAVAKVAPAPKKAVAKKAVAKAAPAPKKAVAKAAPKKAVAKKAVAKAAPAPKKAVAKAAPKKAAPKKAVVKAAPAPKKAVAKKAVAKAAAAPKKAVAKKAAPKKIAPAPKKAAAKKTSR